MSNLYILTPNEQHSFEYPPILSVDMRSICFAITNEVENEINLLKTPTNKVGFLLQYGYFKACNRFFITNRFRQEDMEYASKLLAVEINKIDLSCYKKKMPSEHQKKILTLLNFKPFSKDIYTWLKKDVIQQVERQIEPKQIFIHIINGTTLSRSCF